MNLEAERAVLSAALVQPGAASILAPLLSPHHFYSPQYATIWTAIAHLHADGRPVDEASVRGRLSDMGKLDLAGGVEHLTELALCVPATAYPAEDAARVLEASRLRQARELVKVLADRSDLPDFDLDQVRQTLSQLDRVANDSSHGRSRFTLIDPAELWRPVEPIDWIIEGVAAPGVLTEVQAYGSSGKTWAILAGCIAACAGMPWLDRFPTRQAPTLFLDWESGCRELRRRIQLLARGLQLPMPVVGCGVASFSPPYLDQVEAFREAVATAAGEGYRLIAIDSFLASCPSLQENDSSSRRYLDTLKGLADKHQIGFIVLTHSKKVSGQLTKPDPREAGRGSSAIFDAADLVFAGTYIEGEPLHIVQTKSRLGKKLDPFDVAIVDSTDPVGRPCVLVQAHDPERKQEVSPAENFDRALALVIDTVRRNPGCSVRFVCSQVKGCGGRDTVLAAIERALDRSAIVNRGGTTNGTAKRLYVEHSDGREAAE